MAKASIERFLARFASLAFALALLALVACPPDTVAPESEESLPPAAERADASQAPIQAPLPTSL